MQARLNLFHAAVKVALRLVLLLLLQRCTALGEMPKYYTSWRF